MSHVNFTPESILHYYSGGRQGLAATGRKLSASLNIRLPTSRRKSQCHTTSLSESAVLERHGIALGDGPVYEDTDTRTLTTKSGYFTRITFPKQWDTHVSLHRQPLFHATSGTIEITFDDHKKASNMAHYVRTCDVDSSLNDEPRTEGEILTLRNGNILEIGTTRNRQTERVESYKERWSVPDRRDIAGDNENLQTATTTPVVVAELITNTCCKGRIIRIGDYCQGIQEICSRKGANVLVSSYTKRPDNVGGDEDDDDITPTREYPEKDVDELWEEDERGCLTSIRTTYEVCFSQSIPCLWVCGEERRVGDRFEQGSEGDVWEVVEVQR